MRWLIVVVVVAFTSSAIAQEAPTPPAPEVTAAPIPRFDTSGAVALLGKDVIITFDSGGATEGTLAEVSRTKIVLVIAGHSFDVDAARIGSIRLGKVETPEERRQPEASAEQHANEADRATRRAHEEDRQAQVDRAAGEAKNHSGLALGWFSVGGTLIAASLGTCAFWALVFGAPFVIIGACGLAVAGCGALVMGAIESASASAAETQMHAMAY